MRRFLTGWLALIVLIAVFGTAHDARAGGYPLYKAVPCGSNEITLAITNGTGLAFGLQNLGNCSITLTCRDNVVGGNPVGDTLTLEPKTSAGFACPNTARSMNAKPNGVAADGNSKLKGVSGP
jgi:hypothetical protein